VKEDQAQGPGKAETIPTRVGTTVDTARSTLEGTTGTTTAAITLTTNAGTIHRKEEKTSRDTKNEVAPNILILI
jgi:hypothetical protein